MTEPQRGYAVYTQGVLVLAFAEGPGPVLGAMTGLPPLVNHAVLHGRLHVAAREAELKPLIAAAPDCASLAQALGKAGLEVRPTPLSALAWALR